MSVSAASHEHAEEVRAALRSIVSDPDFGVAALSSRRAMESLLKDLLPDRPRDAAILVAAAEHGAAASLRERVEVEGMDAGLAVRLTTAMFARATAFTPQACEWAIIELAVALGLDVSSIPAMPPTAGTPPSPGPAAVTQRPGAETAPAPAGPTVPSPGGPPFPPQRPIPQPQWPIPQPQGPTFPPQVPKPRRKTALYGTAGVAVAVVAAVVIIALHKPPLPTPLISVTVASADDPVDGNVFVDYRTSGHATATITATVSRGTRGEVAELTGQQYPFSAAPAVLASAKITGRSQHLSFSVTPSLATRYRIEVLPSAGASTPLAGSASRTVYVALRAQFSYTQNTCPRPKCFVTIRYRVPVPHAAIGTESAKHVYFYWAVNLQPSGPEPADPTTLDLQTVTTAAPTILGPDEYQEILAFNFTVNQDAYRWHSRICTTDDVSADGIGLPGNHLCGSSAIPASPGYLGSVTG
jgi:hypothetical protein